MLPFNRLEKILEETERYDKACIIVEGKKDKNVLEKIGFRNIIDISGKTIPEVVNKIISNHFQFTIVLTDFDGDGELKASQLTKLLQHHEVHILPNIREKFIPFKIHEIEELKRFTKFMEDDYNGKTCSIYDKIFNRSRVCYRRNSREARHHRGNIRPDRGAVGTRP
jgi:5S rRNA maturation endonuclease (ribonuclease M5)